MHDTEQCAVMTTLKACSSDMQCSRSDPAAGLDFASFGSDLEAAKAATLQHTQQSNSGSELRTDVIDGATSVGLLLNGTLLLPRL